MGKNIANQLHGKERDEYLFHRYTYDHLPVHDVSRPLTAAQREEVDELWSGLRYKPDYAWHEFYYARLGYFDARMLAKDVYVSYLIPNLNRQDLAGAYEDKSYYDKRFPDVRWPHTLARVVDGRLMGEDFEPIAYEDLLQSMLEFPEVLVKASLFTLCAKSVSIFDPRTVSAADLQAMADERDGNCVFQELIDQHEITRTLNESSCNTVRVTTLRAGGGIQVLHSSIRIGSPGNRTDVCMSGEHSSLYVAGFDDSFAFMPEVFDSAGNKRHITEFGVDEGTVLPGLEQAYEECRRIHEPLHHFDVVAFDVAIAADGKPTIVEVNLDCPGIVYAQYGHGPFFGEFTEEARQRAAERLAAKLAKEE